MGSSTRARTHPAPLSTGEAAAELGVHERTLRRYISLGRLRCHRLPGGHYRIPRQAIDEFWHENDAECSPRRSAPPEPSAAPTQRTQRARRQPLSREPVVYDLSAKRLEALRARYR